MKGTPIGRRRRSFVLAGVVSIILAIGTFWSDSGYAATARELDVSVDVALERFYQQVEGAKAFANTAKGMLILPNVTKGAFILGVEYGEGALRIGGVTADYYSITAGSIGLQIGGQKKDIFLLFMTDEALSKFRASKGWEAGVDGNVAFVDMGAGGRLDTTTIKDPIVGFVIDVKGLMADVSLKGSKITKLHKER